MALLRFFGSLRWRISLLLVGVLCWLSLLISVITSESVRVQILYDSGQALTLLAQQFSQQLDSSILDRWRELHIMASLDTFQDPDASLARQRNLLETMQATYPYYSVGWADRQRGHRPASTGNCWKAKMSLSVPGSSRAAGTFTSATFTTRCCLPISCRRRPKA